MRTPLAVDENQHCSNSSCCCPCRCALRNNTKIATKKKNAGAGVEQRRVARRREPPETEMGDTSLCEKHKYRKYLFLLNFLLI